MANITLIEDTDNVISSITKEDKTNLDILEVSVTPSTTLDANDVLTYQDKSLTTIFKGIVQTLKFGNGRKIATVYDLGAELMQRNVNHVFSSMSPEDIIEYVITNYTSLTYVTTITSGITISLYVAKNKKAWDIVQEMAELLLANFVTDVAGNFNLELEGGINSPKNITNNNCLLDSTWSRDVSKQYNSITIVGDRLIQEKVESFAGPETSITLAEIPTDMYITVGGVEKTGYILGQSTGDYTVDKETKIVTFAVSSSTIVAKYHYEIPINIRRRDAASIALYGQKDLKVEKSFIKSRDDARNYADYLITKYKDPLLNSTWIVNNNADLYDYTNYKCNDLINVVDSINGISGNFIIKKIQRDFPGKLKITIGSPADDFYFWGKDIQSRVKQLEEKDNNSTIINEDEYISEILNITTTVEVTQIRKHNKDNAWILDDVTISGLDRWWTLNGNALDSSGNENNATWNGSESYVTGKQFPEAGSFDGSTDYLSIAGINTLFSAATSFSISLWFKTSASLGTLLASTISSSDRMAIQASSTEIRSGIYDGVWASKSTANNNTDWTNLILTYDGSVTMLYINNVEAVGTTNPATTTTVGTTIGARTNGDTKFNGAIGDFRVYNKILSAEERLKINNSGNGLTTNGNSQIDSIFQLDGGSYTTLYP